MCEIVLASDQHGLSRFLSALGYMAESRYWHPSVWYVLLQRDQLLLICFCGIHGLVRTLVFKNSRDSQLYQCIKST